MITFLTKLSMFIIELLILLALGSIFFYIKIQIIYKRNNELIKEVLEYNVHCKQHNLVSLVAIDDIYTFKPCAINMLIWTKKQMLPDNKYKIIQNYFANK